MEFSFFLPKGRMLLSLVIFGTIGLVRRHIPLGSVPWLSCGRPWGA